MTKHIDNSRKVSPILDGNGGRFHTGNEKPDEIGVVVDFERRRLTVGGADEYALKRVRNRAMAYDDRFSVIFERAALAMAQAQLRPTASRLIWLALTRLDFASFRTVQLAEWAETLGVTKGAISKGFAELSAVGVIQRRGEREYRLSHRFGWRGAAGAWHHHNRQQQRESVETAVLPVTPADVAEVAAHDPRQPVEKPQVPEPVSQGENRTRREGVPQFGFPFFGGDAA
jgi:hypothetical protein